MWECPAAHLWKNMRCFLENPSFVEEKTIRSDILCPSAMIKRKIGDMKASVYQNRNPKAVENRVENSFLSPQKRFQHRFSTGC